MLICRARSIKDSSLELFVGYTITKVTLKQENCLNLELGINAYSLCI